MQISNSNEHLIRQLSEDKDLFRYFKQVAFLIHRATYGGLNKHGMMALSAIKAKLKEILDDNEKLYLTRLIDTLSLYDLTTLDVKDDSDILNHELYRYIASQRSEDLCDIFIENLPSLNSLILSIPIDSKSIDLVSELVEFTKDNSPSNITELNVRSCNIWETIRNAGKLSDNHIHIAFRTLDDESANILCHKGLCIAKQYLKEIEPEDNRAVKPIGNERPKKAFRPNFGHGIVTAFNKLTGRQLDSSVNIEPDKTYGIFGQKNTQESQPQIAIDTKENNDVEVVVVDDQTISLEKTELDMASKFKGQGFFDLELGFLFNIT